MALLQCSSVSCTGEEDGISIRKTKIEVVPREPLEDPLDDFFGVTDEEAVRRGRRCAERIALILAIPYDEYAN